MSASSACCGKQAGSPSRVAGVIQEVAQLSEEAIADAAALNAAQQRLRELRSLLEAYSPVSSPCRSPSRAADFCVDSPARGQTCEQQQLQQQLQQQEQKPLLVTTPEKTQAKPRRSILKHGNDGDSAAGSAIHAAGRPSVSGLGVGFAQNDGRDGVDEDGMSEDDETQDEEYDGATVFQAVIFEGGGTKGIVYAGALTRLEEAKLLQDVSCFAGSSAGAQTAALAAVGYSGEELKEIMLTAPWNKLLDRSYGCCSCIPNLRRLYNRYGFCTGSELEKHLEMLITKKVGKANFTFQQLYDQTGKSLRCGACNMSTRQFEFLDRKSHPDMPISKAVRASSSIPIVFVPAEWNGDLYVDGGLEGNLPMYAFPEARALAFNLTSAQEMEYIQHKRSPIKGIGDYLHTLADMLLNSAQSEGGWDESATSSDASKWRKSGVDIVNINCGNAGMLDTNMTKEQAEKMVQRGYLAVNSYIGGKKDSQFCAVRSAA